MRSFKIQLPHKPLFHGKTVPFAIDGMVVLLQVSSDSPNNTETKARKKRYYKQRKAKNAIIQSRTVITLCAANCAELGMIN